MIQIYDPGNSNFTNNGDAVIYPDTAEITPELNGIWTGQITVPVSDESGWEHVQAEAVLKMPSYNGEQLFRITDVYRDVSMITGNIQPIFFDSAKDCFIVDTRPTNKAGQAALNDLCANNPKYSAVSDISNRATAYYEYVNLMEALSGGEDNCFLNRWGGEIEYDNFTVRVMSRLGQDRGEVIRYGKNIESIEQNIDDTEIVTRIYPKAYNGRTLTGTKYVDSPLINSYPTVKAGTITFGHIKHKNDATDEDRADPDVIVCKTQAALNTALRAACREQFNLGIDKPRVTIQIDSLADFRKIQGYEQFGKEISLGDTIHLQHSVLEIESTARVVSLTYDAIGQRVTRLTVGELPENYFDSISNTVNKVEKTIRADGTVKAESVAGVMNLERINLYKQYNAAETSEVPAILFECNDLDSELYGAMAIGTQGFQIARQKDEAGDWIFQTIGTAAGLLADAIVAGVLSSKDGLSYWDLDNSEMRFYDNAFDSCVRLDEGFIEFIHNNAVYGKILRMLLSGSDVLQIQGSTAGNGVTFGSDFLQLLADSDIYIKVTNTIVDLLNNWLKITINGSKVDVIDRSDYQYIDANSGGNTYVRIDGKGDYIRLQCGTLNINGYDAYSGTVTISGKRLTIRKGIITGVS